MHPEYHEDKFRPHKVYDHVVIYSTPHSIAHCVFEENKIYMRNVIVHENYQNQGVGRKMMTEIKEAYPNTQFVQTIPMILKNFGKR